MICSATAQGSNSATRLTGLEQSDWQMFSGQPHGVSLRSRDRRRTNAGVPGENWRHNIGICETLFGGRHTHPRIE
jgi:hypothetical protein